MEDREGVPMLVKLRPEAGPNNTMNVKIILSGTRAYSRPVPVPKMPTGLVQIMEGLTRDVLKNNPPDIYEFCANHMDKLLEIRDGPIKKRTLTLEEKITRAQKKVKQKADARYQKHLKEIGKANSNDEKSNIKTKKHIETQRTSTPPLTPPLQHMLKPPVHQDLIFSNASEIEISHGTGIISSDIQNVQFETQPADDVRVENKPINIIQENEKDVVTANKLANCDTKIDMEQLTSTSSENVNNLKLESNNLADDINEVHVEPVSNIESSRNVIESEISKENDDGQPFTDYNEKEVSKENLIINEEDSLLTKDEINLLMEGNEKNLLDMSKTFVSNEEKSTVLNLEQTLNFDHNNQIKTENVVSSTVNKELIGKNVNKTHLQELSGNDREEIKKSTIESNVENIDSIIQLPTILEKNDEKVKHDETESSDRKVIAVDSNNLSRKGQILQEYTDKTDFQSNVDKFDEAFLNNVCDDNGKAIFSDVQSNTTDDIQQELQANNLSELNNDLLKVVHEQASNNEFIIMDNNLKENLLNIDEKKPSNEISSIADSIKNVTVSQSETNTDTKITEKLHKDPEVCKELGYEDNIEANNTGEPESKTVSKISSLNEQSIEILQVGLGDQLNVSPNVELNKYMFNEKEFPKDYEDDSMTQTERNEINLNTDEKVQHADEHELTSQTDKNVVNLSNEGIGHDRVKRDFTEPGYNDESMFSKKSVSGDESTDANDNTSFIESGASETPEDNKQRTNLNSNTMDLETAAVTIQKVFRTFLFKSRASTFDDANEENMPLDDDHDKKDEIEFPATTVSVGKERRGISRMDTVLQTVNEEKSLSLSTDDSSTLSSAATTIQAHVRGFLARTKLHSHKTASTNSLVNSDGPSNASLEGDTELNKNKTILNIHIVPEGDNYLSREESMLTSMDLSLDGSPPSSLNLHPLGYDRNERRKQLKREDAIQSISPPSNNSGKLSEDVDSVKDLLITDGEGTSNSKNLNDIKRTNSDNNQLQPQSGDTSPTNSITIETVVQGYGAVDLESSDPYVETQEKSTKRTLSKMSSDEMDVVTPFEDNPQNEISTESHNASKLMHSGEFHDIVLPTKVSRTDTSVVSEFKNVLVYFLLWNNS